MKLGIFTIFFIIKYFNCEHVSDIVQCKDLNPQNEVDIDEVGSTKRLRFNYLQ